MSLNKTIIKDLKNKVRDLSLTNINEKEVIRFLRKTYYSSIGSKKIKYETYLEVTAYLIVLKVLRS